MHILSSNKKKDEITNTKLQPTKVGNNCMYNLYKCIINAKYYEIFGFKSILNNRSDFHWINDWNLK